MFFDFFDRYEKAKILRFAALITLALIAFAIVFCCSPEDVHAAKSKTSKNASDDPGALPKDDTPDLDDTTPVWFGVDGNSTATIEFLKNSKGKRYEYRAMAKQKLFGYDTFQGSCNDGKYAYSVLYNRINQKCKIVKFSLKTLKVAKVSKALRLNHGNDATFDTKRNKLLVIHYTGKPLRITTIDPKTLKIKKHKDVVIPEKVEGVSKKFTRSIRAFTAIGYDDVNDQYIVAIGGARHYMSISPKFKPLRIIKVPKAGEYTRQGLDVKNEFILRSNSYANKTYNQNVIQIFDIYGNFIKLLYLGNGYEIESVFFKKKTLYATTYRSYYKAKYKKVRKRVLVSYKTNTGQIKYKYKKKKVKVKYYVLARDNNIMKIKNY